MEVAKNMNMNLNTFLFQHRYPFLIALFFLSILTLSYLDGFLRLTLTAQDMLVHVDKRKPNRSELLNRAVDSIRNLPHPMFMSNDRRTIAYNSTCAVSPSILDIQFVNTYWQLVRKSVGFLFLYGAYYDNRALTRRYSKGPVVRILGMMNRYLKPNLVDKDYCQLIFEDEDRPVITKIIDRQYAWVRRFGPVKYHPYVFACRIPKTHHHKVPKSVSIVKNPCDNPRNILGVQYEIPRKKKDFAVCVKALHFPEDRSIEFVEWIELNRLLGAKKIFLYNYGGHPNMSKVMSYYKSTGFVDLTPITHPGDLPNEPHLVYLYHTDEMQEPNNWNMALTSLNDCLYRNLYSYNYLAVVDIDEVIMPRMEILTWKDLMESIQNDYPSKFEDATAFGFRNVHFFEIFIKNRTRYPGIPWYNYHLQHVHRSNRYSALGHGSKCFHKVERILTLHNHYPTTCFDGCKFFEVDREVAHLQHYKPGSGCYPGVSKCSVFQRPRKNLVLDTEIWKYKDELIKRTQKVLKTLGFISRPTSTGGLLRVIPKLFS